MRLANGSPAVRWMRGRRRPDAGANFICECVSFQPCSFLFPLHVLTDATRERPHPHHATRTATPLSPSPRQLIRGTPRTFPLTNPESGREEKKSFFFSLLLHVRLARASTRAFAHPSACPASSARALGWTVTLKWRTVSLGSGWRGRRAACAGGERGGQKETPPLEAAALCLAGGARGFQLPGQGHQALRSNILAKKRGRQGWRGRGHSPLKGQTPLFRAQLVRPQWRQHHGVGGWGGAPLLHHAARASPSARTPPREGERRAV